MQGRDVYAKFMSGQNILSHINIFTKVQGKGKGKS